MTDSATLPDRKKRATRVVTLLKRAYPQAACSLHYKTAHQLLVATILSAQTTDEQVNKITPGLFTKYRTIEDFASADLPGLEQAIRSIGLYRHKARAIKESSAMLLHHFGGQMPDTLDEITRLPGVGRKTGSVVLGTWFGKAEGIVVDTHVRRIARLLGLTDQNDPAKIEHDLMIAVASKNWIILTHLLIDHGRAVCVARRPRCEICLLNRLCPSAQVG
jgi:endonuclease-3